MDTESSAIYEAFGISEPSAEAEAEAPGAVPEDSNTAETPAEAEEPVTETAEETTAEEPAEETAPSGDEESTGTEEEQPESPGMGAVNESTQRAILDAHYAAAFAGKKNPYTGKEIRSRADYDEYIAARERQEQEESRAAALEKVKAAGLDADTISALFAQTPLGQDMQRAAQFSRKMEQQRYNDLLQEAVSRDIREIAKYDPTVKDVDSLVKTAKGKQIAERVKSGKATWLEAWKIENFDKISGARTDAARQAAVNAANSKDHLQSTAQRGSGEIEIPADTKRMFDGFGITDPEKQREAYAKYLNSIRKGSK